MRLVEVSEARRVWFDATDESLHFTTPSSYVRLGAWPRVQAWQVERGGRWVRAVRPVEIDLSAPVDLSGDPPRQLRFPFVTPRLRFGTEAVRAFDERLPPRVRDAVRAWPDLHGWLLEFAAGGPACVDLLVANPALAALLVTRWFADGLTWSGVLDETIALVRSGGRQRDLLAAFGMPRSEAVPRLLRKVPLWCLRRGTACALWEVCATPATLARLRHLPVITGPVLEVAASPVLAAVSDRLLHQLQRLALSPPSGEDDDGASPAELIVTDLLTLGELWAEYRPDQPLRLESLGAVQRQLEALYEDDGREALCLRADERLPPPPFPGGAGIVPLSTIGDLVEESDRQRNCVATYADAVLEGEVAIYRVESPERATLSLRRRDDRWELDELRAAENAAVDLDTRRRVVSWLRAARRGVIDDATLAHEE